jgi:four helix bundle protein
MPTTPADIKRRTKQFAVRVINMTEALPTKPAARVISNQVLRSATSVGANYHSACKARSHAEFIAKLGVVAEEADETVFWLELLVEARLVEAKNMDSLLKEANELVAIFVASQVTARSAIDLAFQSAICNLQSEICNHFPGAAPPACCPVFRSTVNSTSLSRGMSHA